MKILFHKFVQFPVKVEHFDAAMVNVSAPLTAVMEFETALMEVMRLDVAVLLAVAVSMLVKYVVNIELAIE